MVKYHELSFLGIKSIEGHHDYWVFFVSHIRRQAPWQWSARRRIDTIATFALLHQLRMMSFGSERRGSSLGEKIRWKNVSMFHRSKRAARSPHHEYLLIIGLKMLWTIPGMERCVRWSRRVSLACSVDQSGIRLAEKHPLGINRRYIELSAPSFDRQLMIRSKLKKHSCCLCPFFCK